MNTPPQSRRSPKLAAHNPTSAEIQKYLPLVGHAVARFVRRLPPNVQGDDLFAAGVYGLFDSLRKGTARERASRRRTRAKAEVRAPASSSVSTTSPSGDTLPR